MGPCFLPTQAFDLLYAKRRHFPYGITRQLRTFSHSDTLNHCTFVVPNMPPPISCGLLFFMARVLVCMAKRAPWLAPCKCPLPPLHLHGRSCQGLTGAFSDSSSSSLVNRLKQSSRDTFPPVKPFCETRRRESVGRSQASCQKKAGIRTPRLRFP